MEKFEYFEPINSLDDGQLRELLHTAQREEIRKNQKLEAYDERNWFVYLLEGELRLRAPKGENQRIDCMSPRACKPLFSDPNSHEIAVFLANSEVIRFDRNRFTQIINAAGKVEVVDIDVGDVEAGIIRRLFRDYHNGAIAVPSLPELALRVRKLAEDPDPDPRELARLIEHDPPMAGKLLAAANSALVRGRMEICTVPDALVRMGMKSATNLVVSAAMSELFEFSDPLLKSVASVVWNEAVRVGAYARVLAPRFKGSPDRDKSFMLGLLHNIGSASLLAYLEKLSTEVSREAIHHTLDKLRSLISTLVLEKWRMDDDFTTVAGEIGEPQTLHHESSVNLINLARHQAQVATAEVPPTLSVTEMPAYKLLDEPLPVHESGLLELLIDNEEVSALTGVLGQ